jgi:hypothetical protein
VLLLVLGLLGVAGSAGAQDAPETLARIRRGLGQEVLKLPSPGPAPDFRVSITERWRVTDVFSNLDFGKPGPVPPDGVNGYEQQRRLFNPVNKPLMQPYAAFDPRQLAILALQNLAGQDRTPRTSARPLATLALQSLALQSLAGQDLTPRTSALQLAPLALQYLAGQNRTPRTSARQLRRQERAAKADVAEAIADYCAQREDRDDIAICTTP